MEAGFLANQNPIMMNYKISHWQYSLLSFTWIKLRSENYGCLFRNRTIFRRQADSGSHEQKQLPVIQLTRYITTALSGESVIWTKESQMRGCVWGKTLLKHLMRILTGDSVQAGAPSLKNQTTLSAKRCQMLSWVRGTDRARRSTGNGCRKRWAEKQIKELFSCDTFT